MHSGVVPLSGGRGHVAEVTLELPDPLTAHNIQPPRLSITDKQINYIDIVSNLTIDAYSNVVSDQVLSCFIIKI